MGDVNTGRTNFIPFYKQLKTGPSDRRAEDCHCEIRRSAVCRFLVARRSLLTMRHVIFLLISNLMSFEEKGPQQMGEPRIVIARSEEVLSVIFLLRASPF